MSDSRKYQILVLPINRCAFSAGYKNAAYLQQQGYAHYGVDLFSDVSDLTLYACGNGEVVAAGWDGVAGNDRLGNVIAIIYKDVYLPNDIYSSKGTLLARAGDTMDLTCRMFHLSQINCKVGDLVTKDTVIGKYGNTGSTTVNGKKMGYHLHLEFDTDTKWPTLAPGISIGGNIFNRRDTYMSAGGLVDSTIDPSLVWTLDYNQSITGIYQGWYASKDVNLKKYSEVLSGIKGNNSDIIFEGIDVSVHNGVIDWNKVKNSGIDFVMIRLGWTWYAGGLDIDSRFKSNIEGAQAAGLDVGVYVYAYDKTPEAAKISAEKVLDAIKSYKLTFPIAYDMEETKLSGYVTNSKSYNNSIAMAFLNTIENAKYYAILYSYTNFILSYLDMSKLTKYDIWVADYRSKTTLDGQFLYPYGMWQYIGDSGRCDGVTGGCDRNYSYKNYPRIIKDADLNNLKDDTYTTIDPIIPDDIVNDNNAVDWEGIAKTLEIQVRELQDALENIVSDEAVDWGDTVAVMEQQISELQLDLKIANEKVVSLNSSLHECENKASRYKLTIDKIRDFVLKILELLE